MAFTISVSGNVDTSGITYLAAQRIDAAIQTTCLNIEAFAKRNAWVDTGAMRSSIHTEFDSSTANHTGTVVAEAPYAMIQEFGRAPGSKFPPIDAIREWVSHHASSFGAVQTGGGFMAEMDYEKQIDSIAFVIARSIAEKGINAQPFMEPAAESQRQAFSDACAAAMNGSWSSAA